MKKLFRFGLEVVVEKKIEEENMLWHTLEMHHNNAVLRLYSMR